MASLRKVTMGRMHAGPGDVLALCASRGRATGGVGLGLYLCKQVVLAHGGTFELRNANPGLEARVALPLPSLP